jgi:hypothetical protein
VTTFVQPRTVCAPAQDNMAAELRRDESFVSFVKANGWTQDEANFLYAELDKRLQASGFGTVQTADPDVFEKLMRGTAEELRSVGRGLEERAPQMTGTRLLGPDNRPC